MSEAKPNSSKPVKKAICDWTKRELKEHFDQLRTIVEHPRHVCTKCGRAAAARKWLCKPQAID